MHDSCVHVGFFLNGLRKTPTGLWTIPAPKEMSKINRSRKISQTKKKILNKKVIIIMESYGESENSVSCRSFQRAGILPRGMFTRLRSFPVVPVFFFSSSVFTNGAAVFFLARVYL